MERNDELDDLEQEPGPEQDDFVRGVGRASPAPVPWQAVAGDVIAERYVIEAKIGEGGLGVVYRAFDPVLNRKVAIKLLGVVEDEQAFLREARATARVLHPNVVTIHDCGTEPRTAYLVLELLEGATLARRMEGRGAMSLAEALPILSDIASALTRAHDNLVTHRDLSWNNLFQTEAEDGLLKVLDFGFAELVEQRRKKSFARRLRSDPALAATEPRVGGGTPGFAPPEQLAGADVPFKGDLFSFGVVAFRLLTGEFPFPGSTLDEYRIALLTTAPPRLRDRLPGVPPKLDQLVAELLDKDPEARPTTKDVRDLLRALRDEHASTARKQRRKPSVVGEPFRPLCTFEASDELIFFGRDRESAALEKLVADERLVVLQGVSGAGKSSLVRAGLLPKLRDGMFVLRAEIGEDPARSPVELLADRVRAELELLGGTTTETAVEALLAALGRRVGKKILLVLDQFEEIFQARTQERFQHESRVLGRVLRRVLEMAQASVHLLVVIRTDFYGHLEFLKPELPGILDRGMFLLPLDVDATRQAIEGPFEAAGFEFPRGLVEEMIVDLTQDGAVSPVELELVCHALYERGMATGERVLERDDYNRLGGAGKVLGQHITRVEKGWSKERVRSARTILLQLVAKDGVRMAAMRAADLVRVTKQPEGEVEGTLEMLREARIVVPLRLSDGERAYRIGHDKMALAVWERLGAEEQRAVSLRDALRALRKDAPEGGLAFGLWWWIGKHTERKALLAWYAEGAQGADEEEKAVLGRMNAWERRWRRAPWMAALVLLVLFAGGATYANEQRKRDAAYAEEQRNLLKAETLNRATEMESFAEEEIEREPARAMAWLSEASRLRERWATDGDTFYHKHWLLAQEAWHMGIGWMAARHDNGVTSVLFTPPELLWMQATGARSCPNCWPSRKLLFSFGNDGKARVLDLMQGGTAHVLPGSAEDRFTHAAVAPNGEWLVAVERSGQIHVWTWLEKDGEWQPRTVEQPDKFWHVRAMEVSSDGAYLARVSSDGGVDVWETSSWTQKWHWPELTVADFALSPRDGSLFLLGVKGDLRRTDLRSGRTEIISQATDKTVGRKVKVSREGDRVAVYIDDKITMMPTVDGSGRPLAHVKLDGTRLKVGNEITAVEFAQQDGMSSFVTASTSGAIDSIADAGNTWRRTSIRPGWGQTVNRMMTSRDLLWVVTMGTKGGVAMSPLRDSDDQTRWLPSVSASSIAISPDNRILASGTENGDVRLWETQASMIRNLLSETVNTVLAPEPQRRVIAARMHDVVTFDNGDARPTRILEDSRTQHIIGLCEMPDGRIAAGNDLMEILIWNDAGHVDARWQSKTPMGKLLCLPDGRIVQKGELGEVVLWSRDGKGESLGVCGDANVRVSLNPLGTAAYGILDGGIPAVSCGTFEGGIRFFDINNKKVLDWASFSPDDGEIFGLAITSEHEVAAATAKGDIRLWDWVKRTERKIGSRHSGGVGAIVVHRESRLLAAYDGKIRLQWIDSGESRALKISSGFARSLALSTDGHFLTAAGDGGGIRIWPLPPTDPAEFRLWLDAHTPWTLKNGALIPKPVPALSTGFGGPEPPRPTEACIEACRKAQPNDAPPDGETMETCVLKKLEPACKTN